MTEPELCRLCAETKENLIGIYETEGEKLAIETKIAKCLQIQVLITDDLPLMVCIDCYDSLNQCSEFFEKTNQAQISLRQLLTDRKSEPQPIEPNIDYVEETIDFSKNEANHRGVIVHCQLPGNYVNETVNALNTAYFIEGCNRNENSETQEMQDNVKQEERKTQTKKSSPKHTKKNLKRNDQMQKIKEQSELHISSQIDEEQKAALKDNIEIADNYMPVEPESNLEIREKRMVETTKEKKHERKKAEDLEKYPWLCTDCDDKLPSLEALEEHHEKVHNQQVKYMCVQCCKVYDKYYGFLTHVKRHKDKAKYKFNCEDCGKSFIRQKILDSHKAVHREERPYVCQTCGKAFKQRNGLYMHSRCHSTVRNRFPCDQCDKNFSTKPNLEAHKRIHTGIKNFTCDQCGKRFVQKGNLEAHFLTHSPDKPYNCTQCTKAFKTPLQLKKHETVHTGAKPHQCAVCGRTFREKGTLREHNRIHTGAMPFTCEFCGKCFRFKGILITHRRQHTGERPYSCLECEHHFTNWPNYNKHMKRRHGINTSHTKHLINNPQLQQQQPMEQTQQSMEQTQPQIQEQSHAEDPLYIPQIQTEPVQTVQVIQAVPQTAVSQPIVIQTIPTSTIQTFQQTDITNTVQETVFRDRNTYFNAVPVLQNFLPTNLPYNFYSIPNVTENFNSV